MQRKKENPHQFIETSLKAVTREDGELGDLTKRFCARITYTRMGAGAKTGTYGDDNDSRIGNKNQRMVIQTRFVAAQSSASSESGETQADEDQS